MEPARRERRTETTRIARESSSHLFEMKDQGAGSGAGNGLRADDGVDPVPVVFQNPAHGRPAAASSRMSAPDSSILAR